MIGKTVVIDAVDYALDMNACGAQFYWKSV